jgi:hypothetical protein
VVLVVPDRPGAVPAWAAVVDGEDDGDTPLVMEPPSSDPTGGDTSVEGDPPGGEATVELEPLPTAKALTTPAIRVAAVTMTRPLIRAFEGRRIRSW